MSKKCAYCGKEARGTDPIEMSHACDYDQV